MIPTLESCTETRTVAHILTKPPWGLVKLYVLGSSTSMTGITPFNVTLVPEWVHLVPVSFHSMLHPDET